MKQGGDTLGRLVSSTNMPYISGETVTTSGQKEETQVSKYIRHPLSQTANYAIIQLENSPKKNNRNVPRSLLKS